MNHEKLKAALEELGGYQFLSSGHFDEANIAWVKMRYEKNETGYRSLEFLAWLTTDMGRAGEPLTFAPSAAPPYLNEPGEVLCFVLRIYCDDLDEGGFDGILAFIQKCTSEYYGACRA